MEYNRVCTMYCKNQTIGKNLRIVAQLCTSCESHLLRLYVHMSQVLDILQCLDQKKLKQVNHMEYKVGARGVPFPHQSHMSFSRLALGGDDGNGDGGVDSGDGDDGVGDGGGDDDGDNSDCFMWL